MIRRFIEEEDGAQVIEAAILIAIGIALVLAFKGQLVKLWDAVSEQMAEQTKKIKG